MHVNYDIMNYDMKRVTTLIMFFAFMIFPSIVNAECDYNERSRLQSLASNLGYSYNYTETDEGINSKVNLSITITNLMPELYIVDQTNINAYYYNPSKEITINNYKQVAQSCVT